MVAYLRLAVLALVALGAGVVFHPDIASAQADRESSSAAATVEEGSAEPSADEASADAATDEKATDEKGAGAKDAAKKKKQPTLMESLFSGPLMMFLPLGLLFYFLMIRPQQKRSAEAAALMQNLKKGDRVLTVGGIVGVVANLQKDSDQVTLIIDEGSGAKMRVLRSYIARIYSETDKGNDNVKAADLAASDRVGK